MAADPRADYAGHESDGNVASVYGDGQGRYQHIQFNTQDSNVFMIVVPDVMGDAVHRNRLDLKKLYGLDES